MMEHYKPKIYVVCCNEGWIRRETAFTLMRITHDQRVEPKIIMPTLKTYENNLSHSVRDFKKGDYDYMLIIDADNPPSKNPIDLVELGLDVVSCPTPQWNNIDKYPVYFMAMDKAKDGWREHKNRVGLQEVDAVSSGATLIKREVLMAFENPFVREWNSDGTMKTGVDFHFCERAKEKGFRIWAHYDYLSHHFKELDLLEVLNFKNT